MFVQLCKQYSIYFFKSKINLIRNNILSVSFIKSKVLMNKDVLLFMQLCKYFMINLNVYYLIFLFLIKTKKSILNIIKYFYFS
jgi:hypothetical protein